MGLDVNSRESKDESRLLIKDVVMKHMLFQDTFDKLAEESKPAPLRIVRQQISDYLSLVAETLATKAIFDVTSMMDSFCPWHRGGVDGMPWYATLSADSSLKEMLAAGKASLSSRGVDVYSTTADNLVEQQRIIETVFAIFSIRGLTIS